MVEGPTSEILNMNDDMASWTPYHILRVLFSTREANKKESRQAPVPVDFLTLCLV